MPEDILTCVRCQIFNTANCTKTKRLGTHEQHVALYCNARCTLNVFRNYRKLKRQQTRGALKQSRRLFGNYLNWSENVQFFEQLLHIFKSLRCCCQTNSYVWICSKLLAESSLQLEITLSYTHIVYHFTFLAILRFHISIKICRNRSDLSHIDKTKSPNMIQPKYSICAVIQIYDENIKTLPVMLSKTTLIAPKRIRLGETKLMPEQILSHQRNSSARINISRGAGRI